MVGGGPLDTVDYEDRHRTVARSPSRLWRLDRSMLST
jgi:hypothetical protein